MAPGKKRLQNTYRYEYHNENPKGYVSEGDCVTRALACAFKVSWEVITTEQWAFALKNARALSCDKVIEMVIEHHDYIQMKQPLRDDSTKFTPAEFCAICDAAGCKNPIILRLPHHLVTIKRSKEGQYKVFDTFDCSQYGRVGNYYVSSRDKKRLTDYFS